MRKFALAVVIFPLLSFAAVPQLPVPDGHFSVGRTEMQLRGETALVWYPAAKALSAGDYISQKASAEIQASDGYYEQSVETIRSWRQIKTNASEDAPLANGRFSLIIFLPGAGVFAFNYTTLAERFALMVISLSSLITSLHMPLEENMRTMTSRLPKTIWRM